MNKILVKRPWRRDSTYIGLRGREEPNYRRGSTQLHGTGAEVGLITDMQRKPGFWNPPPPEARYAANAWIKREKTTYFYAATAEEAMRLCDEWLVREGDA